MSTLPGVPGKSAETAFTRSTLIDALSKRMELHRTDKPGDAGFLEVIAATSGKAAFQRAQGEMPGTEIR
ncbi:MAG: hypothetical protein QOE41_2146 [Mycobacterium sp.]|jgi:hypothetical protein|nr:hypothetical protein [Mycobacterium sp.]MDT5132835.1 hypothetical protein [Mycobacterium sp.]